MNNFELIEQYLTNKLEGDEKVKFEQQLTSDPALKSEVETQRLIIRTLQKARAAELKSMLNNVPVASASYSLFNSPSFRIAASIVGIGALITAFYFFNNKPEGNIPAPQMSSSIEDSVTGKALIDSSAKVEEQVQSEITQPEEKVAETKTPIQKKTIPANAEVKQPKIEVQDPTEDLAQHENNMAIKSSPKISIEPSKISVETVSNDKKHPFHYQFVQGKLVLFGSFDHEPYEVLEINSNDQTHFLYYKSTYYLLDQKQSAITRLEPITDAVLIKKLNQYKGQ